MFNCKTCEAYREFLVTQRSDMERLRLDLKETVQRLNDSMEKEAEARNKLEEMIFKFVRIIPPSDASPTKLAPQPVQRKTWERTKERLTNELEQDWKRKIEQEQAIISKLDAASGDKSRDIDAMGETEGIYRSGGFGGSKS